MNCLDKSDQKIELQTVAPETAGTGRVTHATISMAYGEYFRMP